MARATQNEKTPAVRTSSSSRGIRVWSRGQVIAVSACGLAALWALTMLTGAGQKAYAMGFFFTEFFAGVIALVALSLTVMMGLLATDRLVLLIRHRVLLQSAHRATGILGVAGLVFHVITKIASGRAGVTDAAVPFVGGRGLYIGLGTIAALLVVSVLWTGIIRARFADVGPKWLWRALHSMAYVSWPFGIIHGLGAGRPPAGWVTFSYVACVVLVVMALMVRLSVTLQRRSRERQQAAALNEAMTGSKSTEETRSKSLLGNLTGRRAEVDDGREKRVRRDTSWADRTSGTWASPTIRRNDPERFTVPVVPEPGTLREPLHPGRGRRDEEPRRRPRHESEREPVGRRATRRDEDMLEYDREPVRRRSHDDSDEVIGRSRRSRADAETGSRYSAAPQRSLEDPEEPWDSPRRWESTVPISADPISGAPISGSPISAAPRSGGGRHSVEDELPMTETDYWRPPARYAPEDEADDTPTLVDLASRRARRAAADRRRRPAPDSVDGAYWAGLQGEAK
ncbi:hypothetical protein [Micromonospora sp. LOL_024]|uniref:hypothetical protein n=1 Tax=Micromonospora sp. LOL_024 TaxID=3345412 RepID=UPI003A89A80A